MNFRKRITASFGARSVRMGLYSAAVTVMVLAILIGVNTFMGALPSDATVIDLTADSLFTLSQQSKDLMRSLDKDVTMYWIVQTGVEDDTVENLLDRYSGNSSHIETVKLDPDLNPTFIKNYPDEEMNNNGVLVVCGERYRYVDIEDIYTETFSYETYDYIYEFDGENAITSAIDYVTSDNLPVIGLLTGHQEWELDDTYERALTLENFLTQQVSLADGQTVPEDVDILLINQPVTDISPEEATRISQFLEKGGDLLLVSNISNTETFDNLYGLMGNYGMEAVPGVVFEADSQYYYYNAFELMPQLNSHGITDPVISSSGAVLLPEAHGILLSETPPQNATLTSLLDTSDSAFSKTGEWPLETYEKESGDIDGPFSLAAICSQTDTHVMWVSGGYVLNSASSSYSNNMDFFMNSMHWMSQRENRISIRPKPLEEEHLIINAQSASTMNLLLLGVIPLCYLGVGVYIFFRRKRK